MGVSRIPDEAMEQLSPQINLIRDGLLDARSGFLMSMSIAMEHELPQLHQELCERVVAVDDLLDYVVPKKVEVPR